MKKITICCFPFAGGSKYSYREFTANPPVSLNFIPLEWPGRGARFKEPILNDLEAIVEDVFNNLKDQLDWNQPYAFYGHSMGATVGFLVAQKIAQSSLPKPLHLFFTGRAAPSVKRNQAYLHSLPKAQFIQKVRALGGMPEEILGNSDLMDFFEPILRADFEALETHHYQPSEPLDIPIDVVIGTKEDISMEQAFAWKKESTASVQIKKMDGDHFFIFKHSLHMMQFMADKLKVTAYETNCI